MTTSRDGGDGSSAPGALTVDLWRASLSRWVLRGPWVQRLCQWGLLAGYAALVALGWGYDAVPGVPVAHPLLYTHAATLLFWVVWFMGLVLAVPVVGRAWCGVCPLGFVADGLGRRGLGLAWPRRLRSGALLPLGFLTGVGAVVWGDAHKSPHRTAVFLAVVGAAAVLSALVWRRSAFCRGLCPVGGVLHLYSRYAPVVVRPVDGALCSCCADRSCTNRRGGWRRWDLGNWVVQRKVFASGCPVALDPPTMDATECVLCLRCLRECSRQNLGVFWGRGPEERMVGRPATVLAVVLAGLVTLALLRTWPAAKEFLTPWSAPPDWVSFLWLGVALPGVALLGPSVWTVVWSALCGSSTAAPRQGLPVPARRVKAPRRLFWEVAGRHVPAFVGPVLGAHGALALVKLNAKAGYVPYLAYDPLGVSTYLAVHLSRTLALPDLLLPLPWLRWCALALWGVGAAAGARAAVRGWPREGGAWATHAFCFAAFSGLLGAALIHWLFPWGR